MRRLLIRLFYAGLLAFVMLSALLYVLIGTAAGSRWLLLSAAHFTHDRFTFAASSGNLLDGLRVDGLRWRSPELDIDIRHALLRWRALDLLAGRLQIETLAAEQVRIVRHPGPAQASSTGPPVLPVAVRVADLRIDDLVFVDGQQRFRLSRMRAGLTLAGSRLSLARLRLESPQGSLAIVGDMHLAAPYMLDLRTAWQVEPEAGTRFVGHGSIRGPLQALHIRQQLTAPFTVSLDGQTDALRQTGSVELSWKHARWPLSGPAAIQSAAGRLQATGGLAAYRLHLDTALKARQLDVSRLQADIEGDRTGLRIDRLTASLLGGTLQAHGKLAWQAKPVWQLAVNVHDIDPGLFDAAWPGRLTGKAFLHGDDRQIAFAVDPVTGRLRGLPANLRMQGVLELARRELKLDGARLDVLGAQADLNGRATEGGADLHFVLEVPKLKAFDAQAGGSLRVSGQISGPWRWPRVDARAEGRQLHLRELSVAHLEATIKPAAQDNLQARVIVQGLDRGGLHIERLALSADGKPARMRLALHAQAPQGRLDAALTGGLSSRKTGWDGRLERLELLPRKGSAWRLSRPAGLRIAPGRIDLALACLRPVSDATAHLCLQMASSPKGIALQTEWQKLPLAMLDPWLPPSLRAGGHLSGQGRLQGPLDALQGQLTASAPDGHIELTRSTGKRRYALPLTQLTLGLHREQLTLSVNGGLPEGGQLAARLDTGLAAQAALSGHIDLKLPHLRFLDGLIPDTQGIEGALMANLTLSGTRAAPSIETRASLERGAMTLNRAAIRMQDVQASLQGSGQTLDIALQARSGPGRIDAKGRVNGLFTPQPVLQLDVKGERFEAVHLPQVSALISPALTVTADPRKIRIRGRVEVPQATIKVKRVPPGAVDVSADTRIVGAAAPSPMHGPQLDAAIELSLGQAVKLDAFGLAGQLTGDMLISQRADAPTVADGSLRIVDGTYSAYGLNLALSRGVLNFAGPVDNPGLDVVAQRQTGDVTAQLTVTGTLKSPRSQVSATPPMSESEALSWLITGHGLAGSSKSDAALLLKALASMHAGDGGNGGLLSSLKARTGLSDIGVQGGSSLQQSSLLLGKYLTPDLYVRYAAGLFDHSNTVSLNYRLSQHFSVEAKSGSAQGIDLLYQIVFGPR